MRIALCILLQNFQLSTFIHLQEHVLFFLYPQVFRISRVDKRDFAPRLAATARSLQLFLFHLWECAARTMSKVISGHACVRFPLSNSLLLPAPALDLRGSTIKIQLSTFLFFLHRPLWLQSLSISPLTDPVWHWSQGGKSCSSRVKVVIHRIRSQMMSRKINSLLTSYLRFPSRMRIFLCVVTVNQSFTLRKRPLDFSSCVYSRTSLTLQACTHVRFLTF